MWCDILSFPTVSTHALTEGDTGGTYPDKNAIVSTHALTEGDMTGKACSLSYRLFQLTPSQRATAVLRLIWSSLMFQLTPSQRATFQDHSSAPHCYVSTHALTEGDFSWLSNSFRRLRFNSRPHRGRQLSEAMILSYLVSTHALTEGDRHGCRKAEVGRVSTHALTEGDGKLSRKWWN